MVILKQTTSLCPTCGAILPADVIEEEGKVYIVRECPEHGISKYLYWSDAEMYKKFDFFEGIGPGIDNPQKEVARGCPLDCGLCTNHKSGTLLANIDLTNRCNLACDFCFANAHACGYIYEPSFDQVVGMMQLLRDQKPVPTPAVQFSGGEPTMRDDLCKIVKKAKEMGFGQVQIATNGIRVAREPDYAQNLKDAGTSTLYLHFDGVTRETNPLIKISKKVIEQCRKAKLGIVLVPTIINGRNDHEVGDIIRFAADNVDVVRGVNYQPVSFTGAASADNVAKERVTIPDLADRIEKQTGGIIKKDYFYPVPCVLPFSDLIETYTGEPQVRFTTHQHCGAATYGFVTEDGIVPINDMINVDEFFAAIKQMGKKLNHGDGSLNKYLTLVEGINEMRISFKDNKVNNNTMFWKIIAQTLVKHDFEALRKFHWNAIFIGTMHFMDCFNYDTDRVQRCCIHYATPDGTLIPFCTYNSGPVYREGIWQKYATPIVTKDEIVDPDAAI